MYIKIVGRLLQGDRERQRVRVERMQRGPMHKGGEEFVIVRITTSNSGRFYRVLLHIYPVILVSFLFARGPACDLTPAVPLLGQE